MEFLGKKKRGKPRRVVLDVVKAATPAVGETEEHAEDRRWKTVDPL